MREVVFTSFGPFRDVLRNPSILVAAAAVTEVGRLGGAASSVVLSVTYAAASTAAAQLPAGAARVHVGVASSRPVVTVERRGRPESGDEPDNDGIVGPADAGDRLPRESRAAAVLVAALREEGAEAELSEDAGGYVCNALLWHSLGTEEETCFVHVPSLSEAAAEALGRQLGRAVVRWLTESSTTRR